MPSNRLPSEDEIRQLIGNPPLFQARVAKGGGQGDRIFVHAPDGRKVPAIALGGDIRGGSVPVYANGGGYLALGNATVQAGETRYGLGYKSGPERDVVQPTPSQDEAYVVHFFIATSYTFFGSTPPAGYAFDQVEEWQHSLWLSDGINTLKVLDTDKYWPLFDLFVNNYPAASGTVAVQGLSVGNDVFLENPLSFPDSVRDRTWFTMLSPTRFLFQLRSRDLTQLDGDGAVDERASISTYLIENWAITASHIQSGIEDGVTPVTYPEAFTPYLQYLYPDASGIPSNSTQAGVTYPNVQNVTRPFVNVVGVPQWVEWSDSGLPGESEQFVEVDEETGEGEPVGQLIENAFAGAQLHLFARNWNVNQNGVSNALDSHPVIPFGQIGTAYRQFTDDTTVFFTDEAATIPPPGSEFTEFQDWGNSATNTIADIKAGSTPFTNMPLVLYHKEVAEGEAGGNRGNRSWLYWGYSVGVVL